MRYLNSRNGLSGCYQIATIEAIPIHDTFKLNLGIFMYRHHSSQLPPIFSTYFTKHVQTHNYPTRNAQDYSINKIKKTSSDCAIRNCGSSFWNSLDKTVKHCKTTKHFRNQLKSIWLSEYNWLHFGACLVYFCVLCLFCKVYFLQGSVYLLKPLLRAWFFSGLYSLLIMSSI